MSVLCYDFQLQSMLGSMWDLAGYNAGVAETHYGSRSGGGGRPRSPGRASGAGSRKAWGNASPKRTGGYDNTDDFDVSSRISGRSGRSGRSEASGTRPW